MPHVKDNGEVFPFLEVITHNQKNPLFSMIVRLILGIHLGQFVGKAYTFFQ